MIARTLALVGGLTGAAGLSQFPEYSQQYTQRLAGAVDELQLFVAEFDADAAKAGLSREAALEDLAQAGTLGASRAETMGATIARYERMRTALTELQDKGPFTRAYHALQFNDMDVAKAAAQDFKPAVPLSFEGAVFSGFGFVAGWIAIALFFGCLRLVFRRRNFGSGAA